MTDNATDKATGDATDDESGDRASSTHDIDLASVDRVLETTRSVRRRIDFLRPIEACVIERCIDIAVQAPTGINAENWRFLVITNPEKKLELAALYRNAFEMLSRARGVPAKSAQSALVDRLHEMPALILVCALGKPLADSAAMQVGFYGSILPAAWSLMLALRSRGIGSTWTSLLTFHSEDVARILEIPDDVTQTVMLPIGYTSGAKLRPAARLSSRDVTYWDRWGTLRDGEV